MNLPDFLTEWPFGEIMIAGHRIGLYHVIIRYQDGESAEELHVRYPTLSPELIEKVLGFYQENKAEVDAYVAREEEQLRVLHAKHPPKFTIEELRRRAEQKKQMGR